MSETGGEKKKMGTGAKVAIGCGSGCLVVVLLIAVAIGIGVFYVKKMVGEYETELKGYGFETVQKSQMIEVTEPIAEPILLKAQSVRIMADCPADVAVLAQICEVYGTIEGTLYFRGQMLTVHPGAEILGGVDVQAQLLQNNGNVEGEITGKYQLIETPAASE